MANTWQELQQQILDEKSILPALAETSPVHQARAESPFSHKQFSDLSPEEEASRSTVLALVDAYDKLSAKNAENLTAKDSILLQQLRGGEPMPEPGPMKKETSILQKILSPGGTALEAIGVPENFINLPQEAKYAPLASGIMSALGAVPSDRAAAATILDSALFGGAGKLLGAAGKALTPAKGIAQQALKPIIKAAAPVRTLSKTAPQVSDIQKTIDRVDELIKQMPEVFPDIAESKKTLPEMTQRILEELL